MVEDGSLGRGPKHALHAAEVAKIATATGAKSATAQGRRHIRSPDKRPAHSRSVSIRYGRLFFCSRILTMDFWSKLPKPFIALAPMEGVTDVVFRHVVAKAARPDVFFTEFTNAASFASEKGNMNARMRLEFTPDEQPIVAQIWGRNPTDFETTAQGLVGMGYGAIDINMGCPDKNVVRTGGGSDLIRHPRLAADIIAVTKRAGLPVSVKTRLGYSELEEWQDWITFLLRQGISCLTVHLRTKKEMSKVEAHYELIPELMRIRDEAAPNTLLMINGDVKDALDATKMVEQFDVDGVMIGRGIFQNPYCFERKPRAHGKDDLIRLLLFHLDEHDRYPDRKFDPLKRFFKVYVRDFSGASEIREKLMHTESSEEVRAILNKV